MNQAALNQPNPLIDQDNQVNVGDLVIEDLKARILAGIEKYGTPLQTNNGRDALLDAYQESLDMTQYLKQSLLEREQKLPTDQETSLDEFFIQSFILISQVHHRRMMDKGFWDGQRNDGELLALIHCEVSEALQEIRKGNPESEKIPPFSALEEEMADVFLRLMDYCSGRNLRVAEAIIAKMEYNNTRPHKHGRAF